MYPIHRGRRLRHPLIRDLVSETSLRRSDLVMPLFIKAGKDIAEPIKSMPNNFQFSLERAVEEVEKWMEMGIKAVLLFGIPNYKDSIGSEALSEQSLIANSIRTFKKKFPSLFVISDVCCCEYTDHGHCGKLVNGLLDNDTSLSLIEKQSVIHAEAGVDLIAPSGMLDGMVKAIRMSLDDNGHNTLPIMSYSTKFSSAFYGPFRDAAESAPQKGDRRGYQLNPANLREAIKESLYDVEEGADILMVKPAMAYLDVIAKIKAETLLPMAAYQVSGEFSMIKAAGQNGWIDEEAVALESLLAIKRAGADLIISYFSKEVVAQLDD